MTKRKKAPLTKQLLRQIPELVLIAKMEWTCIHFDGGVCYRETDDGGIVGEVSDRYCKSKCEEWAPF